MGLNYIGALKFPIKFNKWSEDDSEDLNLFLIANNIDWIQEVFDDDERDEVILYPEYEQPNDYIVKHIIKIMDDFMKPRSIIVNGHLTWLSNDGEKAYRVFIDKDETVVFKELIMFFV